MTGFPSVRGGAGDSLEDTVEGCFAGETRIHPHLGNLEVGLIAQQILGMGNAISIDEMWEGAVALRVDTVGDNTAVGA